MSVPVDPANGTLILRGQSQLNVGDKVSSPALYFDIGPTVERDIRFAATPKCPKRPVTVVGGGGLFRPQAKPHIRRLLNSKTSKVVLWGCGLNDHARTVDDHYPKWVRKADLIGVRDYGKDLPWVPCATCGSLAFDKKREATHELVIYDHLRHKVPVEIEGVPRSHNGAHSNLFGVLDFLGQGNVVLTSSYHGAYWATLLGKHVVAWPFSAKFYSMRHPPVLAKGPDWESCVNKATCYADALAVCRAANQLFYKKVGTDRSLDCQSQNNAVVLRNESQSYTREYSLAIFWDSM